jgi:hypothetical protein
MTDDTKPTRRSMRPTFAQCKDNYERLITVIEPDLAANMAKRLMPTTVRQLIANVKRIERAARKGRKI